MGTISNAKNRPINVQTGTIPNVENGMRNWFQPMVFELVTKSVVDFQALETGTEINFRGVIQPLSGRVLALKPEGQRAWNWLQVHSDPVLLLNVDEIINYRGKHFRIMARKDYELYGYVYYEMQSDWLGSDPAVTP